MNESEIVVIALPRFLPLAEEIAVFFKTAATEYYPKIFSDVFRHCEVIIAVMSAGIVFRCVAPLLTDKGRDPAVIVVSPDGKFAIPLLGGHHGANRVVKMMENIGITPVITTATECMGRPSVEGIAEESGLTIINTDSTRAVNNSLLDTDIPVIRVTHPAIVIVDEGVSVLIRNGTYTVGIGCRRGTDEDEITCSIKRALKENSIDAKDVTAYATTRLKSHESGLISAVHKAGGNLIFLDDFVLKKYSTDTHSRAELIGLPGVAEPAALAISKKKELVMTKTIYGRVTIAIAR